MYPHRIRLRGPWTCEPLARFLGAADGSCRHSTADLPPAFRMSMPGRWSAAGLGDFQGTIRCVRPFGYPGRLDDFERVWLTFAGLDGKATVTLNRQPLGTLEGGACQTEFEITSLLRQRNVLGVEVETLEPGGGLWGEVALEVRAAAFLRSVRFACNKDLVTAHGLVVGEAPRPLELYLFARERFLTYARIEPTAAGQPFTLTGQLGDGETQSSPFRVRVELIDGAVVWHVVDDAIAC